MNIPIANSTYDEVVLISESSAMSCPKPIRPNLILRTILKIITSIDMFLVNFKVKRIGMERLGKKEPCLYLMNHSSFVDLKIAKYLLYPRPFNIITTADAFVGKPKLMHMTGCIPTFKFMTDPAMVKNMMYALRTLNNSVLMYPEASYSFDGTCTPLPKSIGKCIKILNVPVCMIKTSGAFLRRPHYNNLRIRRGVKVSANLKYLLSREDIAKMSPEEIQETVEREFMFDYFREQQEKKIKINNLDRGEGLDRVLYKCPHCMAEGNMKSKGDSLFCTSCGVKYRLTKYGALECLTGEGKFNHIPDWYSWERSEVVREIESGEYSLSSDVDIYAMTDFKSIHYIGTGRISHCSDGWHLTGCYGQLDYRQGVGASYSLYSDYKWYDIDDIISIGTKKLVYYCVPKTYRGIVSKARLATEELFKRK
ncbi:MAG: 1-acyl-sn-glycerol-3-phosphate acyltransferase [Clostridiales bacterium]|nr:1-acyl-sn-glycerol-3-phosphate acyltransferase [Clostridiales bacterium]